MARLYLQSGLLIAILALVAATPNPIPTKQTAEVKTAVPAAPAVPQQAAPAADKAVSKAEQAEGTPLPLSGGYDGYGEYKQEDKHDSYGHDEYKGYEEPEYEEPEYEEPEWKYYHNEGHHGADYYKKEAKKFLLHVASYTQTSNNSFTVNLRCAKEADHADSCLRDDYEDDYKYSKRGRDQDDDSFFTTLSNDYAATCAFEIDETPCLPAIADAVEGLCFPARANCTIAKRAEECGCPYKKGAQFTAEGYFVQLHVKSCDSSNTTSYRKFHGAHSRALTSTQERHDYYDKDGEYSDSEYGSKNDTTINGVAFMFTGHITEGVAHDGYGLKELHGKVRYIHDFSTEEEINRRHKARGIAPRQPKGSKRAQKRALNKRIAVKKMGADAAKTAGYYADEEDDYYGYDYTPYQGAAPLSLVKEGNLEIALFESEYY